MIPWRMWMPTRGELRVLQVDVRAVLSGYCNRSIPRVWGGYAHWRCALRRGHDLPHRYRNYTWASPGARVEYDPVPIMGYGQVPPSPREVIWNGSYLHRIGRMLEERRDLRKRRALR